MFIKRIFKLLFYCFTFGIVNSFSSLSYAGTFSGELNSSTGILFPIKAYLNQTNVCNSIYTGTNCYQQSMQNGWYIGNTGNGVSSTNNPINIYITNGNDYMYTAIAGYADSSIFVNNNPVNIFLSNGNDYITSYIMGFVGTGVLTSSGLSAYENTIIPNDFIGKSIYQDNTFKIGTTILKSTILSSNQKNTLLYASGGVFTTTGTLEISLYNSNTIPIINPSVYNLWKIKTGIFSLLSKLSKS